MKLHGFCTTCHRIKRINVTSSEVSRMVATKSTVPFGICDDCQETK